MKRIEDAWRSLENAQDELHKAKRALRDAKDKLANENERLVRLIVDKGRFDLINVNRAKVAREVNPTSWVDYMYRKQYQLEQQLESVKYNITEANKNNGKNIIPSWCEDTEEAPRY